MKPYFETDLGKLYYGDCLEVMSMLEEKADLCLTDPPYAITQCEWDKEIDLKLLWESLNISSKDSTGFIFTACQPFTSKLVMSNIKKFKYELVWRKSQATGYLNAYKMPMREHENIVLFSNDKLKYNLQLTAKDKRNIRATRRNKPKCKQTENYGVHGIGQNYRKIDPSQSVLKSIFEVNSVYRQNCFHPTQKPLKLFEKLLSIYSDRNDMVVDPFLGSGTTAMACEGLKRQWIGIEREEKYCEIAAKRIEETASQARF